MKPEDQRIAFLQYLGWTDLNRDSKLGNYRALRGTSPEGKADQIAPNPLVDLNILHVAEKMLQFKHQALYQGMIGHITGNKCPALFGQIHSTSTQRLEAFLKTVDRWKE